MNDNMRLSRRQFIKSATIGMGTAALWPGVLGAAPGGRRPNIVLCMTDDQGWGDTSYNGHPLLKTPVLDEMAGRGMRFDRFYAAAPVCSPTRGSVLTGRHPNRFGCFTHGRPIRKEEVTIAQALKRTGYTTGHFGKWHLNGKRGPGKPIPATDPLNPGAVGFDEWFSVSNFFDLNTSFSRNGETVATEGDGSDVIVEEALKFIGTAAKVNKPFMAVVWYGSPHNPHRALPADRAPYAKKGKYGNYYGELAAVDRSMGRLRAGLRDLGIANNTLVWFCSDNGGAAGPLSTGKLRGSKGSLWEGGIRVPGLIEWPERIRNPFRTDVPCSTMDIYPTLVDLLGVEVPEQPLPIDGISLVPLMDGRMRERAKPIPFWVYGRGGRSGDGHAALIDSHFKLHLHPYARKKQGKLPDVLLYDLSKDAVEARDLAAAEPDKVQSMRRHLEEWQVSVKRSLAREDYGKS